MDKKSRSKHLVKKSEIHYNKGEQNEKELLIGDDFKRITGTEECAAEFECAAAELERWGRCIQIEGVDCRQGGHIFELPVACGRKNT